MSLSLQSPNPEDFGYGYEDLYEAVDIEIAGPPPALPGHPPPSQHLSPPIPTEDGRYLYVERYDK